MFRKTYNRSCCCHNYLTAAVNIQFLKMLLHLYCCHISVYYKAFLLQQGLLTVSSC